MLNLKELKLAENINWSKVLAASNHCSGADISSICRDAAYMPMRRKIKQVGGIQKLDEIDQIGLLSEHITEADLMEACNNTKPSVNGADLKKYEQWVKEFGST